LALLASRCFENLLFYSFQTMKLTPPFGAAFSFVVRRVRDEDLTQINVDPFDWAQVSAAADSSVTPRARIRLDLGRSSGRAFTAGRRASAALWT
jgi:hypothetical protein